jgi:two-component system chemotaxis response regulator CheY
MPTVLLIEDDARQREFFRWSLEHAGYRVAEARDGLDGVEAFRSEPAGLVVCDLAMPKLDGLGTIRELLRLDPGVKVVAMSGVDESLKAARALGAVGLLTKPFGPSELLDAVRRGLAGSAAG